jgi:hypothetical protein
MESLTAEQAIVISNIAELCELLEVLDREDQIILKGKLITRINEQGVRLRNLLENP